jgi:hypothetical protein
MPPYFDASESDFFTTKMWEKQENEKCGMFGQKTNGCSVHFTQFKIEILPH